MPVNAAEEWLAGYLDSLNTMALPSRYNQLKECFKDDQKLTDTLVKAMTYEQAQEFEQAYHVWTTTPPMFAAAIAGCQNPTD